MRDRKPTNKKTVKPDVTRLTELSSPRSSGGEGVKFEIHVISSFVTLMLADGFAPCIPPFPITKIKVQAKWAGHDVDDLVIITTDPRNGTIRRLSCQVKETIVIGDNDEFRTVIASAWSDYNKPDVFAQNLDSIALIKGPLSSDDAQHTRTILEWARSGSDCNGFMKKVRLHKLSSDEKRKSLEYFRKALTAAIGSDVTDQQLFDFLRHFHFLGYDLDIKAGVTLSLLHTLISQYSPDEAHSLWSQIVYEVQSLNTVAGELTKESIPEHIKSAFIQKAVKSIPIELSHSLELEFKKSWLDFKHPATLASINLIGGWFETNEQDQVAISTFVDLPFSKWNEDVRDILLEPNTPLKITNGRWQIIDRRKLWKDMGPRIFDETLVKFKDLASTVLSEIDPKYELEPERRIAAGIIGKKLKHSNELRANIAETLALLATQKEPLKNLSIWNPESVPIILVRQLFNNSTWQLWASLGQLLPTLAEAAPEEFLKAIEKTLQQTPTPFIELFNQEGSGIFMTNYMAKILWALETLAWDEELLIRVCLILALLDTVDPGEKNGNRPLESLTKILLPWYPQTLASPEKRKLAFESIVEELPDVAWKLVEKLLPNSTSYSLGNAKPKYRNPLPEDWNPNILNSEFITQMIYYSEAAISLAIGKIDRMIILSKRVENFSPETLIKFIEQISIDDLTKASITERMELWKSLSLFKEKISDDSGMDKTIKKNATTSLNKILKSIKPLSPSQIHHSLFSNNYFPRDKKKETYEQREERMARERSEALKEIIVFGGKEEVSSFTKTVDDPFEVGRALASIDDATNNTYFLPGFLLSEDKKELMMIDGFIKSSFRTKEWPWVESLDIEKWSLDEKTIFLIKLPFTMETWERVTILLGPDEENYWTKVFANGFQDRKHLSYAIDKLIHYKRPSAALKCIYQGDYDSNKIDIQRSFTAFKQPFILEETISPASPYEISIIIKRLQESELSEQDFKQLALIEWSCLPLLNHYDEVKPKSLHHELSSDPDFFMEIITLLYRSEKDNNETVEQTPEQRKLTGNAYRLISDWSTVPGTQKDGSFSETAFETWMTTVKNKCVEGGYWSVASSHIGNVLNYSPSDQNGLWINKTIARHLNSLQNETMRSGYSAGAFNSRGVFGVDPTGKEEEAIGDKFLEKAQALEQAKFPRFAATLKSLAESYYRDAERTRKDHEER